MSWSIGQIREVEGIPFERIDDLHFRVRRKGQDITFCYIDAMHQSDFKPEHQLGKDGKYTEEGSLIFGLKHALIGGITGERRIEKWVPWIRIESLGFKRFYSELNGIRTYHCSWTLQGKFRDRYVELSLEDGQLVWEVGDLMRGIPPGMPTHELNTPTDIVPPMDVRVGVIYESEAFTETALQSGWLKPTEVIPESRRNRDGIITEADSGTQLMIAIAPGSIDDQVTQRMIERTKRNVQWCSDTERWLPYVGRQVFVPDEPQANVI